MPLIERFSDGPLGVTWTASATSNAHNLAGKAGGLLYLDASFAGASLTFSVSFDGGTTYATLQNDGADVSISVTANKVAVLPAELFGAQWVKFVSSGAETCTGKLLLST